MRLSALLCCAVLAAVSGIACLPGADKSQAQQLHASLTDLAQRLASNPEDAEPCSGVGGVRGKLYGLGTQSVRAGVPWPSLGRATEALLVTCGLGELLRLPPSPSRTAQVTREEWRMSAAAQVSAACAALREAAPSLGRPAPAC